MGEFITVARVSDIPDQSARCVEVNGRKIGLVNLGGAIHAIDDTCTHADASLSEGMLNGENIICPLHFAAFNVKTGECTAPPACEGVATYAVRVEGDEIAIEL